MEQFCNEIKHGCESNKNRPLVESLASPLKFLIETLNSLYTKIRGIIHTVKLTKFINLLVSVEDILIKEGFQRIPESSSQTEYSELLQNAVIDFYSILKKFFLYFTTNIFKETTVINYTN